MKEDEFDDVPPIMVVSRSGWLSLENKNLVK
jgi:hypothetical protein